MTHEDAQALHRALLAAFPSEGALEQMLHFGMGVRLAEIASGNLSEQAFAVIKFVESRGLVDQLIQAACEHNPGNAHLRAVAERRVRSRSVASVSSTDGSMTGVETVDKRTLRQAIQDSYSMEELELLCADLEEQLNARGHQIRLSLEDISGNTKAAKVLSLIEFLDRRRLLDTLVETVRAQRRGRL